MKKITRRQMLAGAAGSVLLQSARGNPRRSSSIHMRPNRWFR